MEKMNLTCIMCPLGCNITIEKNQKEYKVTGNTCERGKLYAIEEITAPKRVVTSLIKTKTNVFSVKTNCSVPKNLVFNILNEIKNAPVKNPKIGSVVIKNVLNTGADVVITGKE